MKACTASSEYKARCAQLEAIRQAHDTFQRLERLHLTGIPDCSHYPFGNRFNCAVSGASFGMVPQ